MAARTHRERPRGEALELRDGRWNVVVSPGRGGSLELCELDWLPVLSPAPRLERIGQPPASCCYFPMIPFCNRIENSRFAFGGSIVRLPENMAGERHAIHGHGWQRAWQVQGADATRCRLSYRHEATPDWPWAYEAEQSFEILGSSLRITLGIRNLAPAPMPCGLGFHPFLPAAEGASLAFRAAAVWDGSAGEFPRRRVAVPRDLDFSDGAPLAERLGIDHCFDGWERTATLSFGQSRRSIVVEGCAATERLVVYVPADADYFCVEPVTHAVNAINLPDPAAAGLWTLEPEGHREITMSIGVSSVPRT
ncbi:MAG TPA: aldose 1-epimerase [Gammaproteobacteria bacterium]|nr:aldose 1-epimerase [Gammaproteobacteria bacterium]